MRWLLLLYPDWFRARYGDELCDLVAGSEHRRRDLLDLAVQATRLRWEHTMIRWFRYAANVSVGVALFVLGYALNDLQDGFSELPRHWWSMLALGLVTVSIAVRSAIGVADARTCAPHPR